MRIQVSEASPTVLNHFTALSQGERTAPDDASHPQPAAPIIAQLQTRHLILQEDEDRHTWIATLDAPPLVHHGETALIAALRCHLSLTYGEFLELPDDLIPNQLNYRNLWSASARCGE